MDKKFQIDQLRKDKIIYATEAAAFNAVSILIILGAKEFLSGNLQRIVMLLAIIYGVGHTLYSGFGNLYRLIKIKQLEHQL